jgi:hypothetical protein
MEIKELLDDENNDPKKYFNEEEYSTLYVNREGFSKKDNETADLIEALLDKGITRPELEEIFSKLKEKKAGNMLIDSIKSADRISEKTKLVAACWESGLDFTNDILFFTELCCSADFALAMEALTVVENIEGLVPEETLVKAIAIAQDCKSNNTSISEDLMASLKQRIG